MSIPPSIRRRLRPAVFAGRRSLNRLRRLLRGSTPWDGRHHPALLRFQPWEGQADGLSRYDFLGIRTDASFREQFRPTPAGPLTTDYPPPSAGYFEVIFVLDAVNASAGRERFRMVELGAGYGPWLVTAHRAMQLSHRIPVELVGVEMVPHHFEFAQQHLRNNGIAPEEHRLIHAAVSDYEGQATYRPEPDPALDFGQRMLRETEAAGAIQIPCVRASRLLAECGTVDLMHLDLQGEELRVISDAIEQIDGGVRRLITATHSKKIHRGIRKLLAARGWESVFDFDVRSLARTEFGDVQFLDGLLAFRNSKLL